MDAPALSTPEKSSVDPIEDLCAKGELWPVLHRHPQHIPRHCLGPFSLCQVENKKPRRVFLALP